MRTPGYACGQVDVGAEPVRDLRESLLREAAALPIAPAGRRRGLRARGGRTRRHGYRSARSRPLRCGRDRSAAPRVRTSSETTPSSCAGSSRSATTGCSSPSCRGSTRRQGRDGLRGRRRPAHGRRVAAGARRPASRRAGRRRSARSTAGCATTTRSGSGWRMPRARPVPEGSAAWSEVRAELVDDARQRRPARRPSLLAERYADGPR